MNKAYFATLVTAPIIITGHGAYTTRAGETVTVNASSMEHAFACIGTYDSGAAEVWHRSGRLYVGHESQNDIVAAMPRAYRLHGMDFNVVAEYPDTVAACRSSKTKARRHIERLYQLGKVKSCGSMQQPKYWVEK